MNWQAFFQGVLSGAIGIGIGWWARGIYVRVRTSLDHIDYHEKRHSEPMPPPRVPRTNQERRR